MSNSPINLSILSEEDIKNIETEAYKRLGEYRKTNQIIREEIFTILEKNCTVIYYPIADNEICAFIVKHGVKYFTIINTAIPLEKQIFAAAHELYHLWYTKDSWEILRNVILDGQLNDQIAIDEVKANRFAAELLVPTQLILSELGLRNIKRNVVELKDVVELMDVFLMPYKTIVRRLLEVEYINEEKCRQLLVISDRNENEGVILWQKRLGLCQRNNEKTNRKKFGNLIDISLKLFEKKQITYDKLAHLLKLAEQLPEDYNIHDQEIDLPSEEEILKFMEEED
ncbi:MAG TPA: ImmA/IrrE family metallo-endopeptidase [Bacillota bacterium]|nr:ImmA/IrrE family metallo-endopeptidase [Bacillota bacterium]